MAIEKSLGMEVIGVKGNCDFHSNLPEDRVLSIGDKKYLLPMVIGMMLNGIITNSSIKD